MVEAETPSSSLVGDEAEHTVALAEERSRDMASTRASWQRPQPLTLAPPLAGERAEAPYLRPAGS